MPASFRTRSSYPTSSGGNRRDRGLLRGLVVWLVGITLLVALACGVAMFAPNLVADVGDELSPSPSTEPPPAGERNPSPQAVGDPNRSTYETAVETVSSETIEDFVHAKLNDERTEHGLEPLEWDGTIASVSRAHSADMHEREYFNHTNPDGQGPYDRFGTVADYCQLYGENIAMTWVDTPVTHSDDDEAVVYETAEDVAEGLVEQWLNSQPHREAILEERTRADWDRGGVGVYISADGAVFATHNFCETF